MPWHEMAVLVRAYGRSIPAVRRALTSAGVPLEVDGDDLPLRHEPAVAPLLTALRTVATAALHRGAGAADFAEAAAAGSAHPDEASADEAPAGPQAWLDTETALALLASPLGSMDAADLRRLGRALRDEERAAGNRVPAPSGDLLALALAEPERLVAHDPAYARGAQRLGALLRTARELLEGGGTAEEALWELWSGTPWPGRLERAALRGGAGGRNADRDLDAVCALFDTAARAEERTGGRGALNFLEEVDAQDIAADTLSRRSARPEAVRLMTAHRSKGLEWRMVVVAGVQEGLWPDLRRRGSLLEADRIGHDGLAEPLTPGALLAEERRLLLRRGHPRPRTPRRHRRQGTRRRRRPAVPLPHRTRRRTPRRHRPSPPPPRGRGPRRGAARHHRRPRRVRHPARGGRPPPRPARRAHRRRGAAARTVGPPLPLVGPVRADPLGRPAARPGPARGPLRQRARPARQHLRAPVVPRPRGEGRCPGDRRPGLRQRRPRTRRRGGLRSYARRPGRPHGAARLGLGRAGLRRPLEVAPGEGTGARRTRTLPALARHGPHRPHPGRQRARLRRDAGGGRVRGAHPRLHGPGGAGRRGPGLRRRLQDRQAVPDEGRGRPPPPARRLPAGRPGRGGRRGLRRPAPRVRRRRTRTAAPARPEEGGR